MKKETIWRIRYHCKLVYNGRVVIDGPMERFGHYDELNSSVRNTECMTITKVEWREFRSI